MTDILKTFGWCRLNILFQSLAEDQVEVPGMRWVDARLSRVALPNLGFGLPTLPWTSHIGVFLRKKKKLARVSKGSRPAGR
jgi:hypothetical protein